jgi:2-keto-4-pentenoate hydratase/2-oxohepta-3-ene-1,7-dioic acid hydratase in catechol pathway
VYHTGTQNTKKSQQKNKYAATNHFLLYQTSTQNNKKNGQTKCSNQPCVCVPYEYKNHIKKNAATNQVQMYNTSTKKNKNAAISHAHQRVHKKQQKNTKKKINAATNLVFLYQPSPQ